ncbi:PAS domain-containing protein [Leptolyngbya sp. FACHB-671]|uniref:sensor histidine kinase n=1 Tax=Leptolyngbya sp. FACHB-671 TaxID=2692812 RepID=UPI0016876E64|nr:ATP-binding protein [Leptolyngbya sp. FACHB-671]MBD2070865.1 PAS domain-containing protein [Leptolyngbya sp. FACHB-671]
MTFAEGDRSDEGWMFANFIIPRRLVAVLNPRRSVRARFGLTIAAIALIFSMLASLTIGQTATQQIEQDAGQDLAYLAYQMADRLDSGMFERYRDIQIVATIDTIRDSNSPITAKRLLLEKLQSTYPAYSWIGLTNPQGTVEVSTGGLLEGADVSERPWFISGKLDTFVGDVHEAVLLASLLPNPTKDTLRFVDFAVPVDDLQGKPLGVLAAHLNWAWAEDLKNALSRNLRSQEQDLLVLREDGVVLLGPTELVDQKLDYLKSFQEATLAKTGYLSEVWPDHQSYITGFTASTGYREYEGLNWVVLVRQKTDLAFAPAHRLQRQILFWNLGLGSLVAVLGWFIADYITKPMWAIAHAANRIRRGDARVLIPVVRGQDEIANFSQSLNRLVYELTQKERELKLSNERLKQELVERRQVEKSLRLSEEKFSQLAENIDEAFWICSADGSEVIYVSPAYEQICGYSCEMAYRNPRIWYDSIHPEDREKVTPDFSRESLGNYDEEYRLIHPDGSVVWIRDQAFPVYDEQGQVYRVVGITENITERKRAAETCQQLEQERELSELKSHFIAIASHELRTPLSVISMSLDLLQQPSLNMTEEKKQRYCDRMDNAVKRLTQILDDVLLVARAEAGKLGFAPASLNLVQFCHDLTEEIQLNAGGQHDLVFVCQEQMDQVWMDQNLLNHLLTNLLLNAVKYSPEGGKIDFELSHQQGNAIFQIRDQGIGIPEADQARLFTAFYRCSNTGKLPGTGLGLAIVKEAVELHGGKISVSSMVGKGTTFTVSIPILPSAS